MPSSTSPAAVVISLGRCPLRCVTRFSLRSWGRAPITAVASASISCWSTHSRLARMVSVISPALSAASSSDRSDSLRATGTRLLREPWQEHVETHAGGPPNGWTLTPTYTTSRDTNRRRACKSRLTSRGASVTRHGGSYSTRRDGAYGRLVERPAHLAGGSVCSCDTSRSRP